MFIKHNLKIFVKHELTIFVNKQEQNYHVWATWTIVEPYKFLIHLEQVKVFTWWIISPCMQLHIWESQTIYGRNAVFSISLDEELIMSTLVAITSYDLLTI